jgi:hypothetical protein
MMACSRRLARSLTRQVSVPESHDWVGTEKSDPAAFWGLILWKSLWGQFISIPKEVIGMATTCEDKSRAVPKVIRSGV